MRKCWMEYAISTLLWALENQANSDTWKQILREESVILKIVENNTYWPGYSPWVGKKVDFFQKYT